MTVRSTLLLATLLVIVLVIVGCKHDPDLIINNIIIPNDTTQVSTCDSDTVCFQNDVLPLLISSCANTGCHDVASSVDGAKK